MTKEYFLGKTAGAKANTMNQFCSMTRDAGQKRAVCRPFFGLFPATPLLFSQIRLGALATLDKTIFSLTRTS